MDKRASDFRVPLMYAFLLVGGCASGDEPRSGASQIGGAEDPLDRLAPRVLLDGESFDGWTLAERMVEAATPGVSVTYVEAAGEEWSRAAGVFVSGTTDSITPQTRFMAKSLAKPVTAFATLRLVDQGVLDLDAPLGTYLERWKVPENQFTQARAPTLRHLLSHRAGFTMWGVPSFLPGDTLPTLVQILRGEPPADSDPVTIDYEPGTASRYSGGGYSVLQLLLEDVTGESFPDLMARLVFEPLGMRHSLFHIGVPDSLAGETAAGHEDGRPLPARWESLVQMAAGGLITTAPDMGRFVREILRAQRGDSRVLPTGMAAEMLRDQGDGWGLGLELSGASETLVFSHTGSGDGFRALIAGLPHAGAGLVVLTNSDGRGGELRHEIARAAALFHDWPALKPEVRRTAEIDASWYDRLTGVYEYSDGSTTTVTVTPEGLQAAWGQAVPERLFAHDSLRFFTRSDQSFRFEIIADARDRLEWSGDFGSFVAERVR